MLRLQLCAPTFISSGAGELMDKPFLNQLGRSCSSASNSYCPPQLTLRPRHCRHHYRRRSKRIVIACDSIRGRSSSGSHHEAGDDYIEAVVLMAETLMHYQMRIQGYHDEMKWHSPGKLFPFSVQGKDSRDNIQTLGPGFLRRYRSPTIFLKISCDCDGDYLLPIIVGEYAVEKLITSSQEDEDCPNQFQLAGNIVGKLGYKVKLVQITERVDNIYFANICLHKPGREDIRVDARPSDAINVAKRCSAPIYVNKEIVLTDAVKIVHGMGRLRDAKSTYDVFLDSATDGPDLLAEELDIVTKMNMAAKEERYSDAAIWKDKLLKLRKPKE